MHKYILLILAVILVVALLVISGCGQNGQGQPTSGTNSDNSGEEATGSSSYAIDSISTPIDAVSSASSVAPANLTVSILKVGKADAIICLSGNHTLIIDTGEDEDGAEILEFLENHGVKKVDTLLITHFDKDHVGGADTLINAIPIKRVLLPDYLGDNKEYEEFIRALDDARITPEFVTSSRTLLLGIAHVTVYPPASYEIPDTEDEYDNNLSLVATLEHGNNRFFFAGDVEEDRINELIAEGIIEHFDFLKVPHHGTFSTSFDNFFRLIYPTYAVICDSDKHPADEDTINLLKKYGAEVAETKNGDITVFSDGEKLEMSQK